MFSLTRAILGTVGLLDNKSTSLMLSKGVFTPKTGGVIPTTGEAMITCFPSGSTYFIGFPAQYAYGEIGW